MSSHFELPTEKDVWHTVFDQATRRELQHEDQIAGQRIAAILLTIFSIGLLLAVFTVLIAV